MKNLQKGFVVSLIMVILLLAGGVTYYILKNQAGILVDEPSISSTIICDGGIPCPNPGSIKVTLSTDKVWNVDSNYRISWSNRLPSSSYSYYFVQLGTGTSTQRLASNPGSYGLLKLDKSKNFLDIKLDIQLVTEAVNNSKNRLFNEIKNTFFIRITAYDDKGTPYSQDDSPIAAADSSLFSVSGYITPNQNVNFGDQQQTIATVRAKGEEARTKADLASLRSVAEIYYNKLGSYSGLCTLDNNVKTIQKDLSSAPQSCKDNASTYAFSASLATSGFYCVDSTGYQGQAKSLNTQTVCIK